MHKAVFAVLACVLSAPAWGREPPPFALIRADEDYSYLRDTPVSSWQDTYKFIPLGAQAWLSLGGEIRERTEWFDGARFGIGTRSDTYDLQRLLLHADVHPLPWLRAFVEIGQHDAFGKNKPLAVSDRNSLDLQVGFADITPIGGLTLRVGRQELLFNTTQRFVSVREGPNVRQSFDGLRLMWRNDRLKADLFVVRPLMLERGVFNDSSDAAQGFWGLHVETPWSPTDTAAAFVFGLSRDHVRYGVLSGNERRTSAGGRLAGKHGPWDYDAGGMAQFGSFSGRDISAWGGSIDTGYTLSAPWKPRLGLRFDSGSGGANTAGIGTFQPLFPKGAYFNETSLNSWSNLLALRPSVRVQPLPSLTVEASVLLRWRENVHDAVYLQPSVPLAPTLTNQAREVGQAYGLDGVWKVNRYVTITAEFVRQAAGPAIRLAGGESASFAMVITQLKF